MRVLFATTVLPAGRGSGSEVASSAVIEAIRAAGHSVTVLGYRRKGSALPKAAGEVNVGDRGIETRSAGAVALLWMISALIRRLPYSLAKYRTRRYLAALRDEITRSSPDLLIVDHAQMAWVIRGVALQVPFVYLAHNVEHHLYAEAARASRAPMSWINAREARTIEQVERSLAATASSVWALSTEDASKLGLLRSGSSPLVLSLPPATAGSADDGQKDHDIGLLGTWTWEPNAHGLRWFVERVVPQLSSETIAVAGAGADEIVEHSKAQALGRVDDAGAFLHASRVIAVPSVAGAGVQVKTIDAIATGEPVVATPTALRGIPEPPPTVRVAESPETFAEELRAALHSGVTPAERAAALAWAEARRRLFSSTVSSGLESAIEGAQTQPLRCAYIASRYPYVSHTFILREVLALRARGAEVETVTVRRPDPADVIGRVDEQELASTFAILPTTPGRLIAAHAAAIGHGPLAYFRTLLESLRDAPLGLRTTTWQFFYFVEAVLLWRWLERRALRHVHAHHANVATDLAMIATRLAVRLGESNTWSFTVHGPADFERSDAHKLGLKASRADAVVAISDFARAQILALTGPEHQDRVSVIHCGVDLSNYSMTPRSAGSGPMRVLTVGRLEKRKGHAILLQAVAALRRDDTRVALTVVGDGPERPALESLADELGIADDVSFAGALAADAVTGLYADADAFCLASFSEGVPIVLMEAMASGVPVVATSIAGIPELVEDGRSGLLVTPGSVDELAAAIARLDGDPEARERYAQAGVERVADRYSLADSAAELERLFDRIANVARR